MNTNNLPKVLIIGQPFNNNTGGGITLSSLFNGWDRKKIAVACSGYELLDNIDTNVCNTYYQLGYKEHKWRFPFSYVQRKYSSGLIEFNNKRFQDLTIRKSKFRIKLIMSYFIPLLEYFGLTHYIYKTNLSAEFCKWLTDFDPGIIYVQTTSRDGILFCLSVHSFLKKPIVLHMMDDWPSTISDRGPFKKFWLKKIDREFRILLDKATILMSISDEMANEYKRRYNKDFVTFHNTIDIEFWKKSQKTEYELSDQPSFLYAGRIGLGIETSLELFARAIQLVNGELKTTIKFKLQTKEKPEWANKYDCLLHNSFVSYTELPKVLSEADFLLLPYDFSPKSIKYIQYSMPTKAPEYMITGTPIVILAPAETAIARYAENEKWALVIKENDVYAISESIKQLLNDKELRQFISKNAIRIAENNYNSTFVTDHFKTKICSLVTEES